MKAVFLLSLQNTGRFFQDSSERCPFRYFFPFLLHIIDKTILGKVFMCGIAGFYQPNKNYQQTREFACGILSKMSRVLRHRGPDSSGIWLGREGGLAHARLAVIDLIGGGQPMLRRMGDETVAIIYNGELYNTEELRKELCSLGQRFESTSDTEVVLNGYLEFGPEIVRRLNGIYAFAVLDTQKRQLMLCRDRAGVKPLFYTQCEEELIFASEIKGLFAHPAVVPRLDKRGIQEIFSLGPARIPGSGIFAGVKEGLPGHYLLCGSAGIQDITYWALESHPHEDSAQETIEKTSFLVQDAIRRQMVSDVPICTFLSGGIDSSLVSAVCAAELKKKGRQLHTFSFDFVGNDRFFQANAFQPSRDRPYVDKMAEFLGSCHHYLECSNLTQADRLYDSVLAHDLPSMADIDSSMLQFCSMVKETCKVALTGECADEIFGGYPWFHKKEFFEADTFPWSVDSGARQVLLKEEVLKELKMEEFIRESYEASLAETPYLEGETKMEARRREIAWLNLRWFMQTLLNRMDRTSMYSGLEARVPFADHRIIEYVWNVPWEIKTAGGVAKHLLREASRGLLPEEILFRKKSPYPKTYDTKYEELLADRVREMMGDIQAPVMKYLDKKKVEAFLNASSDYARPWYGQLMAGPQMLAYILQVNFWMERYRVG